ncbi:unnamed protein product [Prorocentrum cordatum]|uniref:Polyketide synthase dehydratase domain-containing protein n=1 Tax=Prorocentrum cordatum TaxID=2364126 RepID=A0ABN9V570_9DINO|nr:unnamed protein product [Polarella glacialis]
MAVPGALVLAGTPEGASSSVALPDGAWDILGLGSSDDPVALAKDWQVKNGQVTLLTAADHVSSRHGVEVEKAEAHRHRWQQEAEERLARARAKRTPVERAAEAGVGVMKQGKFAWSKDGQRAFHWRKLYHALLGDVQETRSGFVTECVISPTAMRLYTDHRVLGAVVVPGVSHVSLFAAVGAVALPSPGMDWHINIKEVLFERPFMINSGAEVIAAVDGGVDPQEVGVPVVYCRAGSVSKVPGPIVPAADWTRSLA